MESYVGLDVSLKRTSICVVDQAGKVLCEGTVNSTPEAIVEFVKLKAAGAVRIGLETGPTSTWLWTAIKAFGLPVICIDARHAKAVLKMQINKSDRNDALGIARIMQCGWYKEVRVKGLASHALRALLESRALLVKMKRDLENQIRGLLKNLGLLVATARGQAFHARVQELVEGKAHLAAAVQPLLETRNGIVRQIANLDRKVLMLARNDHQVRSFMTVPGVGPITALCYRATIDDPSRFKRSRSVGAYVGLTNLQVRRRHVAKLSLRGGWRTPDTRPEMVRTESVGHAIGQACRPAQGQGRRRAQARSDPAPHVDRWNRVPVVGRQGRRPSRGVQPSSRPMSGSDVPAGTMAVARSSDFLQGSIRALRLQH